MKLYRLIESVIKKIYKIPNYTKNEKLKKTFISAIYNTSTHQDLIFSSTNKINYILKNNEQISKIIFINGEFDFGVLKKGLKLLGKKKLKYLVSIGSHVGTTLIPAIKYGLFDSCIAFEPSIENYRLLTANININKIEKKISLFNIGLSDKACNSYLKKNSLDSGDNRVVKSKKNYEKIKLDILDNFTSKMNKKNSFIFMDAQGHEPYILLGAKKTLKKNIPLIFELMPDSINNKQLNIIFKSIQNYKKITDLREDKIIELNKNNFYQIYKKYLKDNFYTDIMVF
jgi:FkbM family methyltransferase